MSQYPDQRKQLLPVAKLLVLTSLRTLCNSAGGQNVTHLVHVTRSQQENMIIDVFQEVSVAHHSAVIFVSSLNATVAPKKIKEVSMTYKTGNKGGQTYTLFLC